MLKTKFKFRIVLIAAVVLFGTVSQEKAVPGMPCALRKVLHSPSSPKESVSAERMEIRGTPLSHTKVIIGTAVKGKTYKGLSMIVYSLEGNSEADTHQNIKREVERFKVVIGVIKQESRGQEDYLSKIEKDISRLIRSEKLNSEALVRGMAEEVRGSEKQAVLSDLIRRLEDFYSLKSEEVRSEVILFEDMMDKYINKLHHQKSESKKNSDKDINLLLQIEIQTLEDIKQQISARIQIEKKKAYHLLFKYSDIEQIKRLKADKEYIILWSNAVLQYESSKSAGVADENNFLRFIGELKPFIEEIIFVLKAKGAVSLDKKQRKDAIKLLNRAVKGLKAERKMLRALKDRAKGHIEEQGLDVERSLIKAGKELSLGKDSEVVSAVVGAFLERIAEIKEAILEPHLPEGELVFFIEKGNPLGIEKEIRLYRGKIKVIVTEEKGSLLHWPIVARSMGVPVITAARPQNESRLMDSVAAGDPVIVDCGEGRIIVNPDKAELKEYREEWKKIEAWESYLYAERMRPSLTLDKVLIPVRANTGIENEESAVSVNNSGADGVGLERVEFWYLDKDAVPARSVLKEIILRKANSCNGILSIRAFDIEQDKWGGSDTGMDYYKTDEGKSLLLDFLIAAREAFDKSDRGNIRVFFPMVRDAEDVDFLWRVLEEAGINESSNNRMAVGFMIELKQAVENLKEIARRADFLSIGTNDLTADLLKGKNETIFEARERLGQALQHPGTVVLDAIETIVREAKDVSGVKEVDVCGELGAEPWFIRFYASLINKFGLSHRQGFLSVSVNPDSVPFVKEYIRGLDISKNESLYGQTEREKQQRGLHRKLSEWAEQGIEAAIEDEFFREKDEDERLWLLESLLFRMADRAFNGKAVGGKIYKDALCSAPIDILPRLEDDIFGFPPFTKGGLGGILEAIFERIRQAYHIEREKIGENDSIKVRGEVFYDKAGVIDKIEVRFVKEVQEGKLIPVSVRSEQTVVPKQGTFGASGYYEAEQDLKTGGHMLFWDSHQQLPAPVRIRWNEERTGYTLRFLNGQGGESFILKPGRGINPAHIVLRGYREEKTVSLKYDIYVIDVFHRWKNLIPLTLEEMELYVNLLSLSSGNPQEHRDAINSITALITGNSSWLGSTEADRVRTLVQFLYDKGPYMYEDIYPWLSKVLITAGTVLSLIEDKQWTKEEAIELLISNDKEFSKMLYENRGMGKDWAYQIIFNLFYEPYLEDKDEIQIRNNEFAIKLFGLNRCPQTWNILVEAYKKGERGEADAVAEAIKARIWRKLNFIGADVNERGYFTDEDIRVVSEALQGKIRIYGKEFIDSQRVRARALNLLFSIRDFNSRAGSGKIDIPQALEDLFLKAQKEDLSASLEESPKHIYLFLGNKRLNISPEFRVMTKRPFIDYNGKGHRTKVKVGKDYYYLNFYRYKDSSYRCELERIIEKIRGKRTKTESIGFIDFKINRNKVEVNRIFVKPEYKSVSDVRSTYARANMDYSLMDMMKVVFLYYIYNKENVRDFSIIEFKDVMKEHRFSPAEVGTLEKFGFVLKESKEEFIGYIGEAKKIHLFLDGGRLMNEPYFEILMDNGRNFYIILKGIRHSIRMPWVYKKIREDEQCREILKDMVRSDRVFISGSYIIPPDSARELEEFIRTEIGMRFKYKIKKGLRELDSMI